MNLKELVCKLQKLGLNKFYHRKSPSCHLLGMTNKQINDKAVKSLTHIEKSLLYLYKVVDSTPVESPEHIITLNTIKGLNCVHGNLTILKNRTKND